MTLENVPVDNRFDVSELSQGSINEAPDDVRGKIKRHKEAVERIKSDPDGYAQERAKEHQQALETVQPRDPSQEGNTTMHEHLQNLKDKCERNPRDVANEAIENHNEYARRTVERAQEVSE